jgi:hypothetical protein
MEGRSYSMRKVIVFLRRRIPQRTTFQTLFRTYDRAIIAHRNPFVLKKITGITDDLLFVEMDSIVAPTMPVGEVATAAGEAVTTWAAKMTGLIQHDREDLLLGTKKRITTVVEATRIETRPGVLASRATAKRIAAGMRTIIQPKVGVTRTPVQNVGVATNTSTTQTMSRAPVGQIGEHLRVSIVEGATMCLSITTP